MNYATLAESYYTAVGQKNMQEAEKYLHPEVQFTGPFATLKGKAAVIEATKNFAAAIKTLKIRAKFGGEGQAMIIYEADFAAPIGKLSSATLVTFDKGLIIGLELFYDSRQVEAKKEEIFS